MIGTSTVVYVMGHCLQESYMRNKNEEKGEKKTNKENILIKDYQLQLRQLRNGTINWETIFNGMLRSTYTNGILEHFI